MVEGEVPAASLGRLMAHPNVVKIVPSPDVLGASAELPSLAPEAGFLPFALKRAPWLALLTVLLAVPAVWRGAARLLRVFIPYES